MNRLDTRENGWELAGNEIYKRNSSTKIGLTKNDISAVVSFDSSYAKHIPYSLLLVDAKLSLK